MQQDTVALFSAALIAMRPTVTLPNDELLAFVRSALERSLNWSNETQAVSGRHLMASTVNKRAQGKGKARLQQKEPTDTVGVPRSDRIPVERGVRILG